MSFAIRNLSVLAYANGFTLWHYNTGGGPAAAVTQPGFFDTGADMLAHGDMVMISAPEGGRMLCIAAVDGRISTAPLN